MVRPGNVALFSHTPSKIYVSPEFHHSYPLKNCLSSLASVLLAFASFSSSCSPLRIIGIIKQRIVFY
jgi:hypothetical protein